MTSILSFYTENQVIKLKTKTLDLYVLNLVFLQNYQQ